MAEGAEKNRRAVQLFSVTATLTVLEDSHTEQYLALRRHSREDFLPETTVQLIGYTPLHIINVLGAVLKTY